MKWTAGGLFSRALFRRDFCGFVEAGKDGFVQLKGIAVFIGDCGGIWGELRRLLRGKGRMRRACTGGRLTLSGS